jgi:hypothetical protein
MLRGDLLSPQPWISLKILPFLPLLWTGDGVPDHLCFCFSLFVLF